MTAIADSEAPGLAAFDRLRAEHEPWLHECFVPPPEFDFMAGGRSAAVIGDAGSGKTAIARALMTRARARNLVVDWRPEPATGAPIPWEESRSQFEVILSLVAHSLLERLATEPVRYLATADWVRDTFGWFVRRYLPKGGPAGRSLLADRLDDRGQEIARRLLDAGGAAIATRDLSATEAARHLLEALQKIELDGIWVVADGLGAQLATAAPDLERSLRAFLSTLPLLQMTGCTYKIMTPLELQNLVIESEAVDRGYLDVYRLDWTMADADEMREDDTEHFNLLREIAERRLALATRAEHFPIEALCGAPGFQQWLQRLGSGSPLGWLTTIRPLVAEYLRPPAEMRRPLSSEQWKKIRQRQTIRVRLAADDSVIVGWRVIRGLGETELRVLGCLLENRNQFVTRDELHRYVFPKDSTREASQRGVVDTALWRLRKALEPFPGQQQIIVSVRNGGVCLKAA